MAVYRIAFQLVFSFFSFPFQFLPFFILKLDNLYLKSIKLSLIITMNLCTIYFLLSFYLFKYKHIFFSNKYNLINK